jgi:hypothetical protein
VPHRVAVGAQGAGKVKQNGGLNFPLRGIQDFVVLPNPGDHTLVLGKTYFLKLRVAYFVLQRETV